MLANGWRSPRSIDRWPGMSLARKHPPSPSYPSHTTQWLGSLYLVKNGRTMPNRCAHLPENTRMSNVCMYVFVFVEPFYIKNLKMQTSDASGTLSLSNHRKVGEMQLTMHTLTWIVYLHTPRVFHSFMVLSREPETICRLSGENATLNTSFWCPTKRRVVSPLEDKSINVIIQYSVQVRIGVGGRLFNCTMRYFTL